MHSILIKYNLFPYLIALGLFMSPGNSIAQETRLYFASYTTENGLAQNLIRKTVQSSSGFIWLITAHGLSRFDADQFKNFNYNKNEKNSLPSDFLTDIIADSGKGIWLASFGNGLIYYSPEKNNFKNFIALKTKNTDINHILKIFIDNNRHIWLGTRSSVYRSKIRKSGLFYSQQPFETHFYKLNENNTPVKVLSFYQDSENNMWIGTKTGLLWADTIKNSCKNVSVETQQFAINSIIEFKKDVLLLATDQGAYLFNTNTHEIINFFKWYNGKDIDPKVKVDALAKDMEGNLWLGTFGEGLINFNFREAKFYKYVKNSDDDYSIRSNLVSNIFIDSSNTMFVGLRGSGLNITKIRNNSFRLYRHKKNKISISSNIIWGMIALSDSSVWIGTQNGLNYFNPIKNTFKNNFAYPYDKTAFVRLFKENNHFVVSSTDFIARFYPGKYRFEVMNWEGTKNLKNNYVSAYYKKDDSTTLIAFYGKGLVEYKPDGGIRKIIKNTENLYIKYMLACGDTMLCMATSGEGLCEYNLNTGNFIKYSVANGLNSNNLNFLYKDSNNILWIAGSAGLNKLDLIQNKLIEFDRKTPEMDYEIYSIEEDHNNYLWMGSNAGLLKFNKNSEHLYIFKAEQGLQNNEFNTASSAQTPDGHLIFGGINGFNYFHPDSIRVSKYVPKIVITGFSLFYKEYGINDHYKNHKILNKGIAFTDTIHLKYNENVIGISFSALDFANPKNISYAYRLRGFNNNWVSTDAFHKYASYTNLAPGNYVFQVKSTNSDRIWADNTKNLYIVIEPAFWQQMWFKLVLIIFVLLLIYIYIRLRTHRAIVQQKKLAALVKEQTFEITEKNIELREQAEELNQLTEQLRSANINLEKKVEKRTKKLKKALTAAKQAENLISSFLSNISHEIRTPMNAISGFTQLIVSTEISDKQKQSYGKIIDQNIDMLLDEFDNIMNIAKLHSGKYRVHNTTFLLNELFDELFNQFNKILLAEKKDIQLVLENQLTLRLFSDKLIIKQIMHHLLDNALKYTEKGKVKFGFFIQHTDHEDCNDMLKTVYDQKIKTNCFLILFVRDTGIGISQKQQKLVFDAFMKVETKEKLFRGTGIGLSIVKKFADIFHAKIKLKSEINEGTEILIKIPLSKI